jgi:hypothetical protein
MAAAKVRLYPKPEGMLECPRSSKGRITLSASMGTSINISHQPTLLRGRRLATIRALVGRSPLDRNFVLRS